MSELGFGFEVKAIDEAGYVAGIAAGYGNVDHGGDMIMPGALTKAISGRGSVPMLLYHDHKHPVGAWKKFDETADGLNVEGKFAMATVAGKEAHALTEIGALPGLSIGYKAIRHQYEGKTRKLHELALHEVSLVPVGMNSRAVVTQIKSIVASGGLPTPSEFEDALREAMGFSKTQAAAIAGKGLTQLLRGEPGSEPGVDFWSALDAQIRA